MGGRIRLFIALIIIVVICLLAHKVGTWQTTTHEDYLEGFWVASDDEYCEHIDIESMMIYFGPAKPMKGRRGHFTRECYIVITPGEENQAFTMVYKPQWAGPSLRQYKLTGCEITFEEEQLWEDKVNIAFDMRSGRLTVYTDKTKYAVVRKEHGL